MSDTTDRWEALKSLLQQGSGATVAEFHKAANIARSTAYKWITTLGIQTDNGSISAADLQDLASIATGEATASELAQRKAEQAKSEKRAEVLGSDAAQTQTAIMGAVGQQVLNAGMMMGQQLSPLFWQGVETGLVTGQASSAQGFLQQLNQQSEGLAANVGVMVEAFTARSQGHTLTLLAGLEPQVLPPTAHQIKCYKDNF